MTNRIRTQITTQIRPLIVGPRLGDSYRAWCEQCLEVVVALTLESASSLLQIPTDKVYELAHGGEVHAVESGARSPLICGNSLSRRSTPQPELISTDDSRQEM